MAKKLTVTEINFKLQEAVIEDAKDVVEDPVPVDFTGLEPDVEGWDEYVELVLEAGPPEKVDEEELG